MVLKNAYSICGIKLIVTVLDTFQPPFWMRPAMVQTVLASRKFRKKKAMGLVENAEPVILMRIGVSD